MASSLGRRGVADGVTWPRSVVCVPELERPVSGSRVLRTARRCFDGAARTMSQTRCSRGRTGHDRRWKDGGLSMCVAKQR